MEDLAQRMAILSIANHRLSFDWMVLPLWMRTLTAMLGVVERLVILLAACNAISMATIPGQIHPSQNLSPRPRIKCVKSPQDCALAIQ